MDIRRGILYAAFAIIAYFLWMTWQHDYPAVTSSTSVVTSHTSTENDLFPSMTTHTATSVSLENKINTQPSSSVVDIHTDVLNVSIDLHQGNIVQTTLLSYPQSIEQKNKPFQLLYNTSEQRYVADSQLLSLHQQNMKELDVTYSTPYTHYNLKNGQKELVVTLNGSGSDGLLIQKQFIFHPGSYLIDVQYIIKNTRETAWQGYMNTRFLRRAPQEDKSNMFHVGSFTGASYSQPGEHRYKKITFKDMTKTNLDVDTQGGWVAMQQHYFLTAWIPQANEKHRLYTRVVDGDYTIGSVSPMIVVDPAQEKNVSAQLYLGPEITDVLKPIAPGLDLTVDYGWLWFISSLLFSVMKAIYSFVGNWGVSIVLVTLFIKLAFYRLSATSYKSMAGMRNLQPKLTALRDRYGDDKVKISQATMELYRQEKVNPLGGCLPIIIQIPVFIALYWVLLESVELRQAPFFWWIKDLASADPLHILPVIMGATMLIQQKLNPAPPDPMQAKIMMFLPVVFTGLFWNFPSGLVLYWIVNNSLSILQQWYITRKYTTDVKPTTKLTLVK